MLRFVSIVIGTTTQGKNGQKAYTTRINRVWPPLDFPGRGRRFAIPATPAYGKVVAKAPNPSHFILESQNISTQIVPSA